MELAHSHPTPSAAATNGAAGGAGAGAVAGAGAGAGVGTTATATPTSLSTYLTRPLSSLTPSDLGNMPVGLFIEILNAQYSLSMTRESIQQVTKTLQDQWFNNANELRLVDQQAFEFLDLPRPLVTSIFNTFHSKTTPASPHHLPIPSIRITSQSISTISTTPTSGYGLVKSFSSSSLSASEGMHHSPSSSARSLLHPHLSHSTSMNDSEGGSGSGTATTRRGHSPRASGDEKLNYLSSDDDEDSDDEHHGSPDEALDLHMLEGGDSQNEADKQKSLNALKQAVEHVCNMSITDEFMLERLRNVLKQGIENSDGKITQSILRDHLKKLTAASVASKNATSTDDIQDKIEQLNIAESKEEAVTALSPSSSAAIPLQLTGTPDASTCGRCRGNRDNKPIFLDCKHRFCSVCLHDYVLQLIGMKRAVGITCPWSTCSTELTTANVQSVLNHEDFENYLQATLMAFIEQDGLTFVCPNSQCNAAISVSPQTNLQVPNPMTEMDDEGKPLTRETWLHFSEFRVRCRDCNTVFCAKCKVIPYHKGYTCAGFVDYQSARHCRFCHSKLDDSNTCKEPANRGPGLRDVCDDDECIAKMALSCDKIKPCGCVCCGIKNETECLPCLKHDLEVAEDYCPICYVEALKDAPCIQSTGSCKHVFHFQCVRDKLAARWPGARVTFEFRTCPVCKQNLQNTALADVLLPILELEANVKEKAIARLKYEGRDKAPEVINKTGQYYNNPIEFAMKLYLFFMCYECKKPYFAGGYQCQEANAPFDPKELICPGCQPSSVEDCPTHGKDWLAYKCRYCCNYANWFCWGTSHFCDKCHKSGVWQQLAVFRTGKNKKKLWEYEQCPSLRQPMDVISRDKSLTDDQKHDKCSKLLAVSSQCVLGVRHPPNGMEYGLGCSMCADNKGDFKSADRTKVETEIKQKLLTVKNELSKSGHSGKSFTYTSDFDMNGVMYYLGTCGKTQPYSNPCEAGFVRVTSSGLMGDSAPLSAAVGRDVVRCVTTPVRNSWFCFDLIDISLCPTHYTLRHYSSWDTECLRNWVLEGSTDGGIWDLLITHDNDEHLNRKGATYTWTIDSRGRRYSQFRVVQTGRNSNNNYYLPMSGFEIYGTLYSDVPQHQHMLESMEMKSPNFKTFTPQSDFDQNGIIWYLGTQNGASATWTNPAETNIVRVVASELASAPPSAPASAAIGREVVRCVTASKPNQWFLIDFKDRRIQPTHYTLRHYNSWDLEALRNWRFEGSTDGQSWYTIMNHVDDQALDRKGASHTWTLPNIPGAFSMFRIWQTGLNSNNHHYLALSGFEIYGKLWEAEVAEMRDGQLILRYSYDFDANGLFYWIGTRGKKQIWRNPAEAGWVSVYSSPLATNPPSAPASAIVGREVVRCVTIPKPDQWFLIDLKAWKIQPTHYTLRHYNSWDTEALRWWRFEASNDGHQWDLLHAHYNDKALNKKGGSHTWVIPGAQRPYRLFRIHQTDVNSNNNHYLACSGIEMYGYVVQMDASEIEKPMTFTAPIPSNPSNPNSPPVVNNPYQPPQQHHPQQLPVRPSQSQPQPYLPAAQANVGGASPSPQPQLPAPLHPHSHPPPHPQGSPPLGSQPSPSPAVPFHHRAESPSIVERSPPYREFQDGMELKYQHDFDVNGLMYYLGTKGYTQPWVNPALLGAVRVTSVPLAVNPRSEPAHAIVGRSTVRCVTLPNRESWFCIELINVWCRPTCYSLKHYDSWDTEALRDWKLQASADGKKWTKLISHKKDTALNAKGATHTWPLPKAKKSYRFFRILQTGKNSNGHWYCALSGFEIYGKIYTTRK